MATSVGNLVRNSGGNSRGPARVRIRKYFRELSYSERFAVSARRLLFPVTIGLVLVASVLLGVFAYFYHQSSEIVEQRIESGFWHSRSGVYAAPYHLRKGRKIKAETLEDLLKRAGYVEGEDNSNIWNGSYSRLAGAVEIRPNPAISPDSLPVHIKISGGRISQIERGSEKVDEFELEPEMLIGRTETKRTGNHVLSYEEIPQHLRDAILTAEDQRFFSHWGIDPAGIVRAASQNLSQGRIQQGGSTITQQLVKNTFLWPERSFRRKFYEAFLAIALENQMTKEQIFALYCNEIYLGQYGSTGVHGVKQAARAYFGKELSELELSESAAIAAMIKNPNRYAPHKNEEEAIERRSFILSRMKDAGIVKETEAAAAMTAKLSLVPPETKTRSIAPYFVDAAARELEAKYSGDYLNSNFNLRTYTTIDTHLQSLAEAAVARRVAALDKVYAKKGVNVQAALVAMDPHTGHVLALVGGRDYQASQFNRVTDARRQPGSTFKPFVYAAALERGYTPISTFPDRPMQVQMIGAKPYEPSNYGNSYVGSNITLKTALARSSNVVAVKTALEVGLDRVAEIAKELGLTNVSEYPSMALGTSEVTPLELAAAYSAFANGGRRVEPTFITSIDGADNGKRFISTPLNEQVLKPQTAYMITDMLRAVVKSGTGRAANGALGSVEFAGKTGSSKDGWFVGYTPDLITVAWIGVDDSEDIRSTGGETALPLWVDFMRSVVDTREEFGSGNFSMPPGLTEIVVDPQTGMLADHYCPHSEQVVVPIHAASSTKCLIHRPSVESTLAVNFETDALYGETVISIPAAEPPVEENIRPYIDQVEEWEFEEPRRKPKKSERKKNEDTVRPRPSIPDDWEDLEKGG